MKLSQVSKENGMYSSARDIWVILAKNVFSQKFSNAEFLSEAPCKNMDEAERLNIDRCCTMSEDLNQFLPEIFTVMKYAVSNKKK